MDGIRRTDGLLTVLAAVLLVMTALAPGCGDRQAPPPQPECEEDQDCPSEKFCEGGRCIPRAPTPPMPPPPECMSSADCNDNRICVDGQCRWECRDDGDCGTGEICRDNRCQPVPECVVDTVHFDFDQYYLTTEAKSILRANVQCLKRKGFGRIAVEGHCDERGSAEYNLSLGQKRAQTVSDFMTDLGIDMTKLKIISYGEERPFDYGHDEDAWAKNRRTETIER